MKVPKIAILVDTSTGWGRRIVRGVLDYTTQHGPWHVWIEARGQNEIFNVPQESDIDGIIARISTPKLVRQLHQRRIPTVNISGLVLKNSDFPRITTDWDAAARLAEEHFRDRALRNFAYAGPIHLSYVHEHEMAFKNVLAETGTSCHLFQPEANPDNQQWSYQHKLLTCWLKSLPKPVGIFTWGFQIGRDIISVCRDVGISVPHDVAVLGGDYDELLSDSCHPALSGIVTPARQIGYQATQMLHSIMSGKEISQKNIFIKPEEIEKRLSTEMLAIDDPKMIKALEFLRDHACEQIQVEDILKVVPMARRSLERRFMQYLGRNPAQEMRRLRINQARELLVKTDLSLDDIAEACGYASYNYLGNVFKAETGYSPGRYRIIARGRR